MSDGAYEPTEERDDRGAGLMIVILVAGALICAGSLGGASYFVWRAARNAAEFERDAAHQAEFEAEEQQASAAHARYERIARAVASGLKAPERLRDSYTADGKPLLSWRVHLLPYLGEEELYKQFKLDEPWDGPTNRKLIEQIPGVYDFHGPRTEWQDGWTYVRGFSQPGGVFEPRAEFAIKDFAPGPDQTLAIFDSGEPVEWTRPDQLDWPNGSLLEVGGSLPRKNEFLAATASGRVIWIDRSIRGDAFKQIASRRHEAKWDRFARQWVR